MSDTPDRISIFRTEDFTQFLNACELANATDCLFVYEMPYPAMDYLKDFSREEVAKLLDIVGGYHSDEKEKWRIAKQIGASLKIDENKVIHVGDSIKLLDSNRIVFIPEGRTVLIVPGEESIKNGLKPNLILRFKNLLSNRLFVLDMQSTEDEDKKLQLDLMWKEAQIRPNTPSEHEQNPPTTSK